MISIPGALSWTPEPKLQEHGHRASAFRGVTVYCQAFTGTQQPTPERRHAGLVLVHSSRR